MANLYNETAWFAGPAAGIRALKQILTVEVSDDMTHVAVNISGEDLVNGWHLRVQETPTSLCLTAWMKWSPIGECFYEVSQAVPGLFMASSSWCVFDNRQLLIAGFDRGQVFRAEPPCFTADREPIKGISDTDGSGELIETVSAGFSAAFLAAQHSFERGHKEPRKAIRILQQTQRRYSASNPPPDSDYAEVIARLEAA